MKNFNNTPVTREIAIRMSERCWEMRDVAKRLTSMSRLNARRLIKGEIGVTWSSAFALSSVFEGTTAEFWRKLDEKRNKSGH